MERQGARQVPYHWAIQVGRQHNLVQVGLRHHGVEEDCGVTGTMHLCQDLDVRAKAIAPVQCVCFFAGGSFGVQNQQRTISSLVLPSEQRGLNGSVLPCSQQP